MNVGMSNLLFWQTYCICSYTLDFNKDLSDLN